MRKAIYGLAAAVAFSVVAPAEAAVGIFDGSEITGVTGITVNGATYDVTFADGTCTGLFNGCDGSDDFAFTNQTDAEAAAQALLDQFFWMWDLPSLTSGCEDPFECFLLVPYNSNVDVAAGVVEQGGLDWIAFGSGPSGLDTTSYDDEVWAVFTRTSPDPSAVPEPTTWAMMLMGFGMAGFALRRQVRSKELKKA